VISHTGAPPAEVPVEVLMVVLPTLVGTRPLWSPRSRRRQPSDGAPIDERAIDERVIDEPAVGVGRQAVTRAPGVVPVKRRNSRIRWAWSAYPHSAATRTQLCRSPSRCRHTTDRRKSRAAN
jgi:hypothetical protein